MEHIYYRISLLTVLFLFLREKKILFNGKPNYTIHLFKRRTITKVTLWGMKVLRPPLPTSCVEYFVPKAVTLAVHLEEDVRVSDTRIPCLITLSHSILKGMPESNVTRPSHVSSHSLHLKGNARVTKVLFDPLAHLLVQFWWEVVLPVPSHTYNTTKNYNRSSQWQLGYRRALFLYIRSLRGER